MAPSSSNCGTTLPRWWADHSKLQPCSRGWQWPLVTSLFQSAEKKNQDLDNIDVHTGPGCGAEAMHDQDAKPAQIARLDWVMQHVHTAHQMVTQQQLGHPDAQGVQQEPQDLRWYILFDADDDVTTKNEELQMGNEKPQVFLPGLLHTGNEVEWEVAFGQQSGLQPLVQKTEQMLHEPWGKSMM